jgi:stage IV sporulation protein FB
MFLFQAPPPTRFDLNFSVAGIPVRVHPLFWLISVLFASSNNLINILIWVVAIFLSILIHELGHAFTMRYYGQRAHVVLHGAGGLAIPEQVHWGGGYASVAPTPMQEILIALAGPFAGFLFAIVILIVVLLTGGSISMAVIFGLPIFPIAQIPNAGSIVNTFILDLLWVNIFWGLINLLPVYPLDGGRVSRYWLLQADPWGGIRTSLWISVITGALVALASFIFLGSIYMAILFGLFAFQSYQSLQTRL